MRPRGFKKIIIKLLAKDRKFFTLNQIVRETGLHRYDVRDVLIELCLEDYLMRIRKERIYAFPTGASRRKGPPLKNVTYRVKSPKALAQRIAPKYRGEGKERRSAFPTACDRMWFIIRKKRVFRRKDLRLLANVKNETARHYTKMLRRGGIIAPSTGSGLTVRGEWRLIKDVGPRRPYVGDFKFQIADRKLK